jgi:uncharacterized protein with FMN-binding domain
MKGASWLVAGGTVVGLVAVLGYHSQSAPPAAALSGAGAASPGSSATPSAPARTPSSTRTSAPAGAKASTKAGTATTAASGTATGPSEQFGYGALDVTVTVQGGRITKISVPSLQTAEPTSQQISQQAIPMLTSEVMSAQSLNVNAVSGATYTSDAYAQSLQAALDKLHFR